MTLSSSHDQLNWRDNLPLTISNISLSIKHLVLS